MSPFSVIRGLEATIIDLTPVLGVPYAESIGGANQFGWLFIFWQVGNTRYKT